jgi:hypothetical protein
MARVHGKKTVVTVDGDDLSVYTDNSEFKLNPDDHDVTTYGKDGHVHDRGLTGGTFTMGGIYDSTAATGPRAVLEPLASSGVVTVIRQPEGAGAGLPQDSFSGLLTSYTETSPVNDYVRWAAEFKISDTVDSTAQSA